jgi:hypothetical protein
MARRLKATPARAATQAKPPARRLKTGQQAAIVLARSDAPLLAREVQQRALRLFRAKPSGLGRAGAIISGLGITTAGYVGIKVKAAIAKPDQGLQLQTT